MDIHDPVKPHPISCADYHRMLEVGLLDEDDRVELIDGVIFDMAPIGTQHGSRTARLNNVLIRALGKRAIVVEQHPIRLGDLSEPEPDIVIIKPEWDFDPDSHPTASHILLIVEVAHSSLAHDRERKIPLYARFGIPEVWLVNLVARELVLYRQPVDGAYAHVETVRSGLVSTQAFADIEIAVESLI